MRPSESVALKELLAGTGDPAVVLLGLGRSGSGRTGRTGTGFPGGVEPDLARAATPDSRATRS
jgi:hypothetical protein